MQRSAKRTKPALRTLRSRAHKLAVGPRSRTVKHALRGRPVLAAPTRRLFTSGRVAAFQRALWSRSSQPPFGSCTRRRQARNDKSPSGLSNCAWQPCRARAERERTSCFLFRFHVPLKRTQSIDLYLVARCCDAESAKIIFLCFKRKTFYDYTAFAECNYFIL